MKGLNRIISVIILLLISCESGSDKILISENVELKNQLYFKIKEAYNAGDTMISIKSITQNAYDSIFIYGSYFSISQIQNEIGNFTIDQFPGKEFIADNKSLLVFKKGDEFIDYVIIDSLHSIPDLEYVRYPISKYCFRLYYYETENGRIGAYLNPVLLSDSVH